MAKSPSAFRRHIVQSSAWNHKRFEAMRRIDLPDNNWLRKRWGRAAAKEGLVGIPNGAKPRSCLISAPVGYDVDTTAIEERILFRKKDKKRIKALKPASTFAKEWIQAEKEGYMLSFTARESQAVGMAIPEPCVRRWSMFGQFFGDAFIGPDPVDIRKMWFITSVPGLCPGLDTMMPTRGAGFVAFWAGLQSGALGSDDLLQPVLSYGGGIASYIPYTWTVSSWRIGPGGDINAFIAPKVYPVAPGTSLQAIIVWLNEPSGWWCGWMNYPDCFVSAPDNWATQRYAVHVWETNNTHACRDRPDMSFGPPTIGSMLWRDKERTWNPAYRANFTVTETSCDKNGWAWIPKDFSYAVQWLSWCNWTAFYP